MPKFMTPQEKEDLKKIREERTIGIEDKINNSKPKLLSCPFCGDTPILVRDRRSGLKDPEFYVRCKCFDYDLDFYRNEDGNIRTPKYRDIDKVIGKWNTRSAVHGAVGEHPTTTV